MQDVNIDNGCMWFVPGSHKKELREHRKVKEGHHANTCNCTEVGADDSAILSFSSIFVHVNFANAG